MANRGLSWYVTRQLLHVIDPHLAQSRVQTGLGGGRAVLDALARPSPRKLSNYGAEPFDHANRRLLVYEPGLAHALEVAEQQHSPLSWIIRNAWDGEPLEILGRGRRMIVDQHHLGIVAHATFDQLLKRFSLTDTSASFINRFIFVLARRQRTLIDEGNVPIELTTAYGATLHDALLKARSISTMGRTTAGESAWHDYYPEIVGDDPQGLFGIATARGNRHVLRLSMVYALCEAKELIDEEHVLAAVALWRYCRRCAELLTTTNALSHVSLKLLEAIQAAGPRGLSLTEQSNVFARNISAQELTRARQALLDAGLVQATIDRTNPSGRPTHRTVAIS